MMDERRNEPGSVRIQGFTLYLMLCVMPSYPDSMYLFHQTGCIRLWEFLVCPDGLSGKDFSVYTWQ